MGRVLRANDVQAAIKGGSIFAAGGGGWVDHGLMLGTAAINAGEPELVTMDEVPDDAWIATAAAIGAPGGTTDWQMLGVDYVNAVKLLQDARGATAKISPILRTAADMAGGFIASCRNPLRASYVREHAALGGISLALSLGEAIIAAEAKGGSAVIDAICATTKGSIIFEGRVSNESIVYTKEAFDVGTITLTSGTRSCRIHVMNEYMAVEDGDGTRMAT